MAAGWGRELDALMASVRPRFGRAEPRRHAETYVRGLLSDLARKNAWTFATLAGARDPTSMQRMLNAARWDTDGVRDDVRRWVVHRFGDWNRGTLVVDEVRFPKIGSSSVGVHRLFAPGSLRAVDAQVAVFLAYVSPRGRVLVDRDLYLPEEWLADRARVRRLGVPDEVTYSAPDELAIRMLERTFEAHGPTAWVAAGESLTASGRLQAWLQERGQPHALAVPAETVIPIRDGAQVEAGRLTDAVPASAWIRTEPASRYHDPDERWAMIRHTGSAEQGLLIRRSPALPTGSGFYQCRYPSDAGLVELVRAARSATAVQDAVGWANENIGLDHYQVRRYDAWYRLMTLCLLAGAVVAAALLEP